LSILSNLFRPRDKPRNNINSMPGFFFGGTTAGKYVNERTAMQSTAVYACVRIISEAIASLPLHVYRYRPDGSKERVVNHPLYHLLHDEPNDEMTSFVLRETMTAHLLLYGNAYAQIVRNGRGDVIEIYPLMPNRMGVYRDANRQIFYRYMSDYGEFTFTVDDILHVPGLGFDGLIGYSPIAMAKNAIGVSLAAEEYGAGFFSNGAMPGGILEHPNIVKDPAALRDSWAQAFGGSGNAKKVAVLEEGMKFQAISVPPEDAQFLETRKFQVDEIARIFRVPPHMVGDLEKATFNNIEQLSLEFVKYTLQPWLIRLEQAMNKSLLLPSEKSSVFVKFNLDGMLRGDFESRMRGYSTGIQNGIYSFNEVRQLEDMDLLSDDEGGNTHAINGAMMKLSQIGAAYQKGVDDNNA